tara:strand:+ start:320 stop:520 length:201 start_codon:yes stop_codon:yes gene_type:complete
MTLTETQLEVVIESIQDALNVLNRVDYECDNMNPKNVEKTAPYAVGYSKATLESLIETIQAIQSHN